MSKLLNKPFKTFTLYALVILVCSIPVYYRVVDTIWLEELDEHNQLIRNRMEYGIGRVDPDDTEFLRTLKVWNSLQPGTKLEAMDLSEVKKDSTYTTSIYNRYEQEMDRFRVLSTHISIHGKPYSLTIATNVEETDETMLAIAYVTVLFFVLLVLGFVVLNRRIALKSWKPFRDTLEKLKAFDLNKDRGIRFEQSGILEFEELNRVLQQLIDKNISVFHQQKTFIENASHELQTPLAVLRTKIDLLLQNESLTEAQSEIVTAIGNNLLRVSRINKNLLLLARIENNQFSEKSLIDVAEVLGDTIALLEDYMEDRKIGLQLHVPAYRVHCNRTLLEVLFNNLLINTVLHSQPDNTVSIHMENTTLTFSNAGTHSLDRTRLFRRFVVSSAEKTSSGLGLAIVKEICDRYDWEISYSFENKRHCFSVHF